MILIIIIIISLGCFDGRESIDVLLTGLLREDDLANDAGVAARLTHEISVVGTARQRLLATESSFETFLDKYFNICYYLGDI